MAPKSFSEGRRNALAAFALVALVGASATARADSIFDLFMPEANPYVVQNNIARWGFVQHSALARRGDVYLCDVVDRQGAPQRLIIDAHSGRIVERYALRPYAWQDAGRFDPRPRLETREWGSMTRPEVDVPVPATRPKVIEAFPQEAPLDDNRIPRQSQFAYGEGHAATPSPAPDPRPVEKPKLRLAHPKHAPAPAASDLPETATAAPSASEPAVEPPAMAIPQAAPAPAAPQPAQATPPASGVFASTGAAAVPAPKAAPPPAQPPKTKAINDIPVAPLD